MTGERLTPTAAIALAEAVLAAERPGARILSAWCDDDGVAVSYGVAEDIIAIGNGPMLVDRRTGVVSFLGSLDQRERLDAMAELAL